MLWRLGFPSSYMAELGLPSTNNRPPRKPNSTETEPSQRGATGRLPLRSVGCPRTPLKKARPTPPPNPNSHGFPAEPTGKQLEGFPRIPLKKKPPPPFIPSAPARHRQFSRNGPESTGAPPSRLIVGAANYWQMAKMQYN